MKVMISQPMNGVPDSEVRKIQNDLKEKFAKYNIDVVDSFLTWIPDTEIKNPRLFYLGRTIQNFLSDVDAVYFCTGWEKAKGCRIERCICEEYGILILDNSFLKLTERKYYHTEDIIKYFDFDCNLAEAVTYIANANRISYDHCRCIRNLKLALKYLSIECDIVSHRILDNGDDSCLKKTSMSREFASNIASKIISDWCLSDELSLAFMRLVECQFATSYSDYLENVKWAMKYINKEIMYSNMLSKKGNRNEETKNQ